MELYKRVTIIAADSKFHGISYFHKLVRKGDGKLYWEYDQQWMFKNESPPHFTDLDPKERETRQYDIPFLEGDI